MKNERPSILILCVGNYLMGDEGLGVHLARLLEKERLPEGIDLLEGGTAGFQLMEALERHPIVIMVDATLDDHPVGTIRRIEPRFASDFPKAMSTHEIGIKDLVESLSLMEKLPTIYLFVMTVADIAHLHIGLSPAVEKAMYQLKDEVVSLANDLVAQNTYELPMHV